MRCWLARGVYNNGGVGVASSSSSSRGLLARGMVDKEVARKEG